MKQKSPLFILMFCATLSAIASWGSERAEAQSFSRALKQVAEQLSKSSDESSKAIGEAATHLARRGDDVTERLGQELGNGGSAFTTSQALDEFRRLGVSDTAGDLEQMLNGLTPAGRRGLIDVLELSKRALDVGTRNGMDAPSILRSLDNGGADAILSLRGMKSEEGVIGCLRGFNEFGEPFNDFVRKGDEAAVQVLSKHWETVRRLPSSTRNDLLANPAKYIDANGGLTRQGDNLLRGNSPPLRANRAKKGLLAGAAAMVIYALSPDRIIDLLELVLPPGLIALLRGFRWIVWWAVVAGFVWFFWPFLFPVFRWILIYLFRLLGKLPGTLGLWFSKKLKHAEESTDRDFFKPKASWKPPLRIGLLGLQRVGKSTFIVMLQKHLTHLVPGASLIPVDADDQAAIEEITGLVSRCEPTRDDQTVKLNLTWPYDRNGKQSVSAENSASDSTGNLKERLILTDFPGEWAATQADMADRKKLINFLNDVDGLFIVIDPTDLENPDGGHRTKKQLEAIQAMLREDGLGLGKRFHRALAVLFTKRDALASSLVSSFDRNPSENSRTKELLDRDRIVALSEKESLSSEESQELGKMLFDLLFPNERMALEQRLAPEIPVNRSLSRWGRLKQMFRRSNHPEFAVFAISQLGKDLGRQVVRHRQRVEAWQNGEWHGDKPTTLLDLPNVNPLQLDLRHPFQWMFDKIPQACLYQADQLGGPRGFWYRLSTYRRFGGASVVRADRRTSWTRRAALLGCVIVAGLITQPIADWKQRSDHRRQVTLLFEDAAGQSLSNDILDRRLREARSLPTNPMPKELAYFEQLLSGKGRLEALWESGRDTNRSLDDRIGDLKEWLRTAGDLPSDSSLQLSSLREFRNRITNSTPNVFAEVLKAAKERTDVLASDNKFDSAIRVTKDLELALERIPGSDSTHAEVQQLSKVLSDDHFHYDLRRLNDEISELISKDPPEYVKVVESIDNFWVGKPERLDRSEELASLRSEQTQQFRNYIDGRLNELIREGRFDDVHRLFEQFERSLDSNDHLERKWVREQRNGLPERQVRAAIANGKNDLEQGDADAAWEKLDAVRVPLMDSREESQKEWYIIAAKVKLQQQDWEHAISLFCHKDTIELPWAREERNKAWDRWTETLETSIPLMLAQGNTQEARNLISRHQNCQFEETCPPDYRSRINMLASTIPKAELASMLDEAEKLVKTAQGISEELEHARQILAGARTSASHVRDEDTELLFRWRRAMVDVLQKLDRHPQAINFLRSLSSDPVFSERITVEAKPTETDVWNNYLLRLQEIFETRIKEGQAEEAWLLLAEAQGNSLAPDKFSKDVEKFALQRIVFRLEELQREINNHVAHSDFAGAKRLIEDGRKELGGWAKGEASHAYRLVEMETDIRRIELDQQLARLENKLKDRRNRGKSLHKDISTQMREIDLSDEQRRRLSELEDKNVGYWEADQFANVKSAYNDRDFVKLDQAVKAYVSETTYHRKSTSARLKSVKDLQNWFERFENEQNYTLTAIRIQGMPDTRVVSRHDPAAKVTIKASKPYVVTAQEDNKAGSFELRSFQNTNTFRWRKGVTIEIGIWDDSVGKGGHCMGIVKLTNPYSLLDIGLPGTLDAVPYKQHDYKNDASFNALRVGLTIEDLRLPKLIE